MQISNHLLCRTPALAPNADIKVYWDLLSELIKSASPTFYQQIAHVRADDLATLPPKIQHTVWKYFNRARYRATPFGSFACISLVSIARTLGSTSLILEQKPAVTQLVDWQEAETLHYDASDYLDQAQYLQSNTSYYRVGSEIRYLYKNEGVFELTALDDDEIVGLVLETCRHRRLKQDVYQVMADKGFSEMESMGLLVELIKLQLLLTDRHPNITGTDYFQRLGYRSTVQTPIYSIACRQVVSGAFPRDSLDILKEAVTLLHRMVPVSDNGHLKRFRQAFVQRFDHQVAVPLMEALDPELGVGYAQLGRNQGVDGLVNIIQSDRAQSMADSVAYQPFHRWLLKGIMAGESMQLADFVPNKEEVPVPLPNSFQAIIQAHDGMISIKSMGGCTANALLGRFSLVDPDIETYCKQIAETEQQANPDVIFFDVAVQGDKHVDNINRRKRIYATELPILTWSEADQCLDLNDMLVQVIKGEVILSSRALGKRLVPRLATAYNFTRSDLAVVRFLSDLQHQHLHIRLSLRPAHFFPGLVHYPRIMHKHIIVSPECWRLPDTFRQRGGGQKLLAQLKAWLKTKGIKQAFRCGVADRNLCFDPNNEDDLKHFLLYSQSQDEVYLEEALLPKASQVYDASGNAYVAEWMVAITHQQTVYRGLSVRPKAQPIDPMETHFMPGSDWLYLKIYIHPTRVNALFQLALHPGLVRIQSHLIKWFFIRYFDIDHHVRLRMHLKTPQDIGFIMQMLNDVLQDSVQSGTVPQVQYDIYRREVTRYGDRIDAVEELFGFDSLFALRVLEAQLSVEGLYHISLRLLTYIITGNGWLPTVQWAYIKQIAQSFAEEHKLSNLQFKEINAHFRRFQTWQVSLPEDFENHLQRLGTQYIDVLNDMAIPQAKVLLADLFHMHINRLHATDQRVHELIVYQYALKTLASKRAHVRN